MAGRLRQELLDPWGGVIAGVAGGLGTALARAQAAPGTRLCLIGAGPRTLAELAADCRQRGARADIFCVREGSERALADYLAAVDRDAPVDTLLVHADPDAVPGEPPADDEILDGPLAAMAPIVAAMRRRGRGEIVLISDLAGRAMAGERRDTLRAAKAFRGYAEMLRRQLRADGVSLAVVVPRAAALRAAARLRAPLLTSVGADRLAEQIGRALRRRCVVLAVPGPARAAMRALRAFPAWLGEAARDMLLPRAPADEASVPGETGPGD